MKCNNISYMGYKSSIYSIVCNVKTMGFHFCEILIQQSDLKSFEDSEKAQIL